MATATSHPLLRHIRRLAAAPGPELSDAHLLARFADCGDEAAFETLVKRHGPIVLGVCRRVLGDWHAAEDCFQVAFTLLAQRAGSLRQPERLGPWLFGVAHRTALKARARAARRGACERRAATTATREPPDDPLWRDLRPVLDDAVARLPEKHRLPFVLHYLQGEAVDDVARRLGWPRGTVATRLARARAQLRKGLTRRGVTLSSAGLTAGLFARTLSAALPPRLARLTVRAVAAVRQGVVTSTGSAAAGPAFGNGGLNAMVTMSWKSVVAVLLVAALAVGGASWLSPGARADKQGGAADGRPAQGNKAPAGYTDRKTPPTPQLSGPTPVPAGAEQRLVVQNKLRQYRIDVLLASGEIGPNLDDLRRRGKTKLLAEPRLVTLEGREASILSGGNVVVPGKQLRTIEYLPVGHTVRVKVDALADGLLHLTASLERAEKEVSGKTGWRRQRSVVEAFERVKLGEAVRLVLKATADRPQDWALIRVVREETTQSRTESREPAEQGQGSPRVPAYTVAPPDMLQIDMTAGLLATPVRGAHLVRPDGTVGLGTYGSAHVTGLTLEQARTAIAKAIVAKVGSGGKTLRQVADGLSVDVLAYNSRAYYVIRDVEGRGQEVTRLPFTGSDTILDALAQLKDLPPASRCRVRVERGPQAGEGRRQVLNVDWLGITRDGLTSTNYQLQPGDRVFVTAAPK